MSTVLSISTRYFLFWDGVDDLLLETHPRGSAVTPSHRSSRLLALTGRGVLQYATDVNNLIMKNFEIEILGGKSECVLFVLKIVWNTPSLT